MDIQNNQEALISTPANGIEHTSCGYCEAGIVEDHAEEPYSFAIKCQACKALTHKLALFPGDICVNCYEAAIDSGAVNLMSAGDVSRAFGGR